MSWKDAAKEALYFNPTKKLLQRGVDIYNDPYKALVTEPAENFAKNIEEDPLGTMMNLGGMGTMVGPKATGWSKLRQFTPLYEGERVSSGIMPRAEISDELAHLTPVAQSRLAMVKEGISPEFPDLKMSEVINHPELYKQYPDVADMPAQFRKTKTVSRGTALRGSSDEPAAVRLFLQNIKDPLSKELTESGMTDTLLHELQHQIQFKEGFAEGASPQTYEKIQQNALKNYDPDMPKNKSLELDADPFKLYARTAGEIEARDTAQRKGMTEAEREWSGPEVTQVTPELGTYETRNMPYENQRYPVDRWVDPKEYRSLVSDEPQSPKSLVEMLGFKHNGISPAHKNVPEMHWITDPLTGGTYVLPSEQMTMEGLTKKINAKRAEFKAPLLGEEEAPQSLAEGGKPTPAEAIDRFYKTGKSKSVEDDLKLAAKYGDNPYDFRRQDTDAMMMNALDSGPKENTINYIKNRGVNTYTPDDVTAAHIYQSGARRNYQIDPETNKMLDDFINEHLDISPKVKKPLPNVGGE